MCLTQDKARQSTDWGEGPEKANAMEPVEESNQESNLY